MKMCVYNSKKQCISCGECDICDLNREKKCDNCGICLQLEGIDIKAVKIDELNQKLNTTDNVKTLKVKAKKDAINKAKIENLNASEVEEIKPLTDSDQLISELLDLESYDNYEESCSYEEGIDDDVSLDVMDNNDMWEYIDDVDNLSEILEDDLLSKNYTTEVAPGLIVYNSRSRE
ncbi:hypothetical protein SAMN02745196_00677 [Clostridium collagenovorans DSM 3089]|uniref:Uncharacterized protein n=1 Tax=Clostridium collagenovorans DSM 3089 TaxID=1121306 RepID=A0A1M5TQX8_9CLOT|nr:hypothetical protein [Clostridium collagenovorans]SHH53006.1 hypothetical protein SAMN02745196_00677 [Clostridium collagenovorans DSM 3089]